MLESYINEYYQFCISKFDGLEKVKIKELAKYSIPLPIKKYIDEEAKQLVDYSLSNILTNSVFDLEDDNLFDLKNNISDLLSNSITLDYQRFCIFLKNVIEIRFNYVLRPRVTLSSIIFEKKNEEDSLVIERYFNYFTNYDYLKTKYQDYLNNNPQIIVSKEDFESALEEIDTKYIYDLDKVDFLNLIYPIFELFTYDGINNSDEVPIEAILIFFDEKGLTPLIDKLSDLINSENIEKINFNQFKKIILEIDSEFEEDEETLDYEFDYVQLEEDIDSLDYEFDSDIIDENLATGTEIKIEKEEFIHSLDSFNDNFDNFEESNVNSGTNKVNISDELINTLDDLDLEEADYQPYSLKKSFSEEISDIDKDIKIEHNFNVLSPKNNSEKSDSKEDFDLDDFDSISESILNPKAKEKEVAKTPEEKPKVLTASSNTENDIFDEINNLEKIYPIIPIEDINLSFDNMKVNDFQKDILNSISDLI